jgi:predicted acyltransferase
MATLVREAVKPGRVLSLDIVRGITIAFMILVNDNGSEKDAYAQLKHAAWNGWTLTDLVFPSFLFMVGIAVVYSIEARLAKGETKKALLLHTLQRAVVLFCFGLIVNAFPHFHLASWRIYGVLQRISICYLVVSALYLYSRRVASFVALVAVALVGYYIIMRWIPVPGFGMPVRDVPLLDMDKNWVAYIDRALMPAARLYQKVRDPEGLLSTLPALGTAGLGVLTGFWLRSAKSGMVKAGGLLAGAVLGIASGELWNIWFPINKKMWTSSYVLFAAGCTLLVLAVCYFVFDVKKLRKAWGYPWLVFGSNAITAYMVSELLAATLGSIHLMCGGAMTNLQRCIFRGVFQNVGSPAFGSLLYSLAYVAVCFVPNWVLYRKKIFLKV